MYSIIVAQARKLMSPIENAHRWLTENSTAATRAFILNLATIECKLCGISVVIIVAATRISRAASKLELETKQNAENPHLQVILTFKCV